MIIAYNIGGYHPRFGSGAMVTTFYPKVWEIEDISEFIEYVREFADEFFQFAKDNHIPPSHLTIFLTVRHHSFRIPLINVREYRQVWEETYNKKWKFDREL